MRLRLQKQVIALTIAGSDSGGGAGVQADLKTFLDCGVHGTSAITCITAQNPSGVTAVEPCTAGIVRAQIAAVFDDLPPAAIKTGMLFSSSLIRAVTKELSRQPPCPLVVDPVMVATSGASLLARDAVADLTRLLFPKATLITPNVPEAEVLTGRSLRTPIQLRTAAGELDDRFGCAVLMKGGHLRGRTEALDILFDGRLFHEFKAPYVRGVSTHGTGCTYSAAIAAWLARGSSLREAVARAKRHISLAIKHSRRAGRHSVLGFGLSGGG